MIQPPVIKGETADVTRGCTGITNEELYKCSAHEVGQQVITIITIVIIIIIVIIVITIIVVVKFYKPVFIFIIVIIVIISSFSLLATATETDVTRTGRLLETQWETHLR